MSFLLAESVCDPANPAYNLTLVFNESFVDIALEGGGVEESLQLSFMSRMEDFLITIGNVPACKLLGLVLHLPIKC